MFYLNVIASPRPESEFLKWTNLHFLQCVRFRCVSPPPPTPKHTQASSNNNMHSTSFETQFTFVVFNVEQNYVIILRAEHRKKFEALKR